MFRQAAASPAPPITGSAYIWPHPSGLFNVQIGADGTVGGFVSGPINDPSQSDLTRATAQVVGSVWAYPFIHGNGIAAPVTGNEIPDSTLSEIVLSFFAFNKGMVDSGYGFTGTNVFQGAAAATTPTTVTANQPGVVAQYQAQVTAAINAAKSAIAQVPLSTQVLAAAVGALNISGPGVPNLVSSVTPSLESQRQQYVTQLTALLTQWTNTWNADVANIPGSDPAGQKMSADLINGQNAITSAINGAVSGLQASALSLLKQSESANPDGTATTTNPDGSTTVTDASGNVVATTPPIQMAGLSGTAAIIGIAAIGLAILVGGKKGRGKRR